MITSCDRLVIRDALAVPRLNSRSLHILVPTITNVTYVADTDSGKDPSSSDGTGRTVTWKAYSLLANVRQIDHNLITFWHVPLGAQAGKARRVWRIRKMIGAEGE